MVCWLLLVHVRSPIRLSVDCSVRLSRLSPVAFVHPNQAIEIFGNILRHWVPSHPLISR